MNYIFMSFLWYFIIYSVAGWILETIYVSLNEKKFINRGFLHGCYCPIYGFGMCTIILIISPYKDNIMTVLFGAIILATVLEYFTGWVLEKLFNARWWDYSGYKFNLNGRVSLFRSIQWGILALFMNNFVHPHVERTVNTIINSTNFYLIYIIYIVLIVDFIYSIIGASKLSGKIRALDYIKKELQSVVNSSGFSGKTNSLISKHNHIISNIIGNRFLKAFPNIIKSKMINKLMEIKDDFYEKFK